MDTQYRFWTGACRRGIRVGVVLPFVVVLPLLSGAEQCVEVECVDEDGDGYGEGACPAPDCDDTDAGVYPFAAEDCGDGEDNDCDGLVDAADLECTVENMVEVPAGLFYRGTCNGGTVPSCSEGDPGYSSTWSEIETPIREIYVDGFYIDRYEVSVADYAVCVAAGACNEKDFLTHADFGFCHFGDPGYEQHPMNCVGWFGADAYCRFAGKRLPTEAEWEKAARGTEGARFPWGNEGASCEKANYSNATNVFCEGSTAPVDTRPDGVSPYGAFNMAGNVWEWVSDWYDPDYYDVDYPYPDYSPDENPQGPDTGEYKLIRGGSWVSAEGFIRTTMKHYYRPNTATEDLGFRCVRDL